jgi:hypothetical protein
MKHLKLFESFEVVEPVKYGEPLNNKEINFLKGYNIICPEWILKDDNYYYVYDHRCENIKDVPEAYINFICGKYNIRNYTINDDFTIDVNGGVYLNKKGLSKLPLKFNIVSGNFDCFDNLLTTLEGSPRSVYHFDCSYNELTTLEGSPKEVFGHFECPHNKLTTLEGGPECVGGDFNCSFNYLTSLKESPKEVYGSFNCYSNNLTSLEGSTKTIGGCFNCQLNHLTTLKGGPESVGGGFNCSYNQLATLEGEPKHIGGVFEYKGNPLKSIMKWKWNT